MHLLKNKNRKMPAAASPRFVLAAFNIHRFFHKKASSQS